MYSICNKHPTLYNTPSKKVAFSFVCFPHKVSLHFSGSLFAKDLAGTGGRAQNSPHHCTCQKNRKGCNHLQSFPSVDFDHCIFLEH